MGGVASAGANKLLEWVGVDKNVEEKRESIASVSEFVSCGVGAGTFGPGIRVIVPLTAGGGLSEADLASSFTRFSYIESGQVREVFVVPDHVKDLVEDCFVDIPPLSHVLFGSAANLEHMSKKAFYGTDITQMSIPDGVKKIEQGCFRECKNLSFVTFGLSSSIAHFGSWFLERTKVTEIMVPDTVVEICDMCFHECNTLRRVIFGSGSRVVRFGKSAFLGIPIESLDVPDSVESIGDRCFMECRKLVRLNFGYSSRLRKMDCDACYRCLKLEILFLPKTVEQLSSCCFSDAISLAKIFLPYGLHSIQDHALSYTHVCQICIPDSVVEICDHAFLACRSLLRITFGVNSKLRWIGTECFSETALIDVDLPRSLEAIGASCFRESPLLRRVTFAMAQRVQNDNPLSGHIGDSCFLGCLTLETIQFGSDCNIMVIGLRAFMETGVKEIVFHDSLRMISEHAFEGCKMLESVKFGPSSRLEWIKNRAFFGTSIEEIEIPDSVKEIGKQCFDNCVNLKRVKFGEGSCLTRIGNSAFGTSGAIVTGKGAELQERYHRRLARLPFTYR